VVGRAPADDAETEGLAELADGDVAAFELPDDEQPATAASTPTAAATAATAGRRRYATDDTVNQPQIWFSCTRQRIAVVAARPVLIGPSSVIMTLERRRSPPLRRGRGREEYTLCHSESRS
jgi:hypothetical protein